MHIGLYLYIITLLPALLVLDPPSPAEVTAVQLQAADKASVIFNKMYSEELSVDAFSIAYEGFTKILSAQMLKNDSLLTLIDYSLPSDRKRLWVIDIKNAQIVENSLVAHGQGSGIINAESFSDIPHSHQSSLGFFITGKTYSGKHGYSLTMDGLEAGINQNARKRAIVFHGAHYVSATFIEKNGRLGRSFGCPALPPDKNTRIIDLIKDSSCVFIYSPDPNYLSRSKYATASYYSQKVR